MEYFDVVDKNDKPTGQLTSKVGAHSDNVLHRCVAVYVFDKEGKLVVQNHKKSGLLDHSVGGHVSTGEDYAIAARREGDEELGLIGEKLEEVCTSLYSDENFAPGMQKYGYYHMFGIYECHPSADWKFVPNDEVEQVVPMELAEVVRLMNETPGKFTPGFINTMAKYLEIKQLPYTLDMANIRKNWGKTR